MKSHRQYVRERVKRDRRFAEDLAAARAEVRLAVELARLREQRGLSQRRLASLTGIKQPQIARIEKGVQMPTIETVLRLLDVLNARITIGPHQQIGARMVRARG